MLKYFLALLLLAAPVSAQVSVPNVLTAGATIQAAGLNTNFSALGDASLNRTGGAVTGTITVDAGITIDGADISAYLAGGKLLASSTAADSLDVEGGITAGTGNVAIVDTTGKIPAISSAYFASLSGANLTGPIADTRLSANVPLKDATNAFTGANSFDTNALDLLVGQLVFPATQNPSADANTFDDYQEGTWTPIITGSTSASGQVYSTQAGSYIKIGRLVHVQGRVILSTLGTVTGTVRIGGLPFTSATTSADFGVMSIGAWAGLSTAAAYVAGFVVSNNTQIDLRLLPTASSGFTNTMAQADLSAITDFLFSGTYLAAE